MWPPFSLLPPSNAASGRLQTTRSGCRRRVGGKCRACTCQTAAQTAADRLARAELGGEFARRLKAEDIRLCTLSQSGELSTDGGRVFRRMFAGFSFVSRISTSFRRPFFSASRSPSVAAGGTRREREFHENKPPAGRPRCFYALVSIVVGRPAALWVRKTRMAYGQLGCVLLFVDGVKTRPADCVRENVLSIRTIERLLPAASGPRGCL